jgi:hypothetical protein
MTYDDAVELVQGWPEDRSVPRKLAKAIAEAKGQDALLLGMFVEALTTAAASEEDYQLIEKYFG